MTDFAKPLSEFQGVGVEPLPTPGQGVALDHKGNMPWGTLPETRLSYVTFTANVTTTATTEGLSTTVITADTLYFDGFTTVLLEFWCAAIGQGTTNISVEFMDSIDGATAVGLGGFMSGSSTNSFNMSLETTPSQAKHVYSVHTWVPGGGTGTIFAQSGGANKNLTGYLRVSRVF